jgi:hypothetical protein
MSCRRRKMTLTAVRWSRSTVLSRTALYGQWAGEGTRDSWAAAYPSTTRFTLSGENISDGQPPTWARRGPTATSAYAFLWAMSQPQEVRSRIGDITPEFSGRTPTCSDVHFIPHGRCNELLGCASTGLRMLSPQCPHLVMNMTVNGGFRPNGGSSLSKNDSPHKGHASR